MVETSGAHDDYLESTTNRLHTLESFVPVSVMEKVLYDGIPSKPSSSSCDCAVALADISGFTKLTEALTKDTPGGKGLEDLSKILNNYFSKMIRIIHANGGDVMKFAGDALLIVFRDFHAPTRSKVPSPDCLPRNVDNNTRANHEWRTQIRSFRSTPSSSLQPSPRASSAPNSLQHQRYYAASFAPQKLRSNQAEEVTTCARCESRSVTMQTVLCGICGDFACRGCSTHEVYNVRTSQLYSACDFCFSSPTTNLSTKAWQLPRLRTIHEIDGASSSLHDIVLRCTQCCLQMQKELDGVHNLRLHIGIGVGNVQFLHIGGVMDRWEFLIAGDALAQMSIAEQSAIHGQVCLSKEAFSYITCKAAKSAAHKKEHGVVHVAAVQEQIAPIPTPKYAEAIKNQESKYDLHAINQFLLRYIPGGARGHMDAMALDSYTPLGELRSASILFVNFRHIDYSAPSASILKCLQKIMSQLQHITYSYEGLIRQFLMDDKGTTAIIVFGLYPFAHENDPLLATRCAMAIEASLERFECNIGITTGEVFAGVVGSLMRCEYAVIGDVVNLAARLMTSASDMPDVNILCDEATCKRAAVGVEFIELQPISVKGKLEPVKLHFPVAETTAADTSHRDSFGGLLGPQPILTALKRHVDDLIQLNKGSIAVIEAKHGVGKSRLCGEFLAGVHGEPTISVLQLWAASFNKHDGCKTFSKVFHDTLQLLYEREGISHSDLTVAQVQRSLQNLIHEVASNSIYELGQFQSFVDSLETNSSLSKLLSAVLGKPFGSRIFSPSKFAFTSSEADALLHELLHLFILVRLELAHLQQQHVIVVIDGLQYLDEITWNSVQHLVLQITTSQWPLLIIASTRPLGDTEDLSFEQLVYHKQYHKLKHVSNALTWYRLKELDALHTKCLIAQTLKVAFQGVPDTIVQFIFRLSGGNPLYIQQILDGLQETKSLLIKRAESVEASSSSPLSPRRTMDRIDFHLVEGLDSVALPEALQSLLRSRIDRLSPTKQWLLKIASVAGMTRISVNLVVFVMARMTDSTSCFSDAQDKESGARLEADLAELVHLDFFFAIRKPDNEQYDFHNPMIREAAYSLLLNDQKRVIHNAIADFIVENEVQLANHHYQSSDFYLEHQRLTRSGALAQSYASLGIHRAKAGQLETSIDCFLKAYEIPKYTFSNPQIIQYLRGAMAADKGVKNLMWNLMPDHVINQVLHFPKDIVPVPTCSTVDGGCWSTLCYKIYVRAIKWNRLIGEALYQLHQPTLASLHFRISLAIVFHLGNVKHVSEFPINVKLNAPRVILDTCRFAQVDDFLLTTQGNACPNPFPLISRLRILFKAYKSREPRQYHGVDAITTSITREAATILVCFAQFCLSQEQNIMAAFELAVACLEMSQSLSTDWALEAKAFALVSTLLVELRHQSQLFSKCMKLSLKLAGRSGDPTVYSTIHAQLFTLAFGQGHLEGPNGAKHEAEQTIKAFEILGNTLQMERARLNLSWVLSLQGNIHEARALLTNIMATMTSRRDKIGQIRCLCHQLAIDEVTDFDQFIQHFHELEVLDMALAEDLNFVDEIAIQVWRLKARLLEKGTESVEWKPIVQALRGCSSWSLQLLPTLVSVLEVLFVLLLQTRTESVVFFFSVRYQSSSSKLPNSEATDVKLELSELLLGMRLYARKYPLARASYKRFRGVWKSIHNKPHVARKKFTESLEAARRWGGLKLEEALAHAELSYQVSSKKLEATHFAAADEIFTQARASELSQQLQRAKKQQHLISAD